MSAVNKEEFKSTVRLLALKIPAKSCTDYLNNFKDAMYMRPKMKRIYDAPDDAQKRLLILSEQYQAISDLPEHLKEFNDKHGGEAQDYHLQLGYEHFSVDEVLNKLLPNLAEVPSAFEQAGHLAHLNLREEALPYKHLIAQVLLEKNPTIKTVVNKIGNIETEFRTFPMELLGGEDNYEVTLRESGARFTFNFAQVYWNSRLQMEHSRVIEWIQATAGQRPVHSNNNGKGKHQNKKSANKKDGAKDDVAAVVATVPTSTAPYKNFTQPPLVVADMMAGVGPFAVPLGMAVNFNTTVADREIKVHANDLNPASFKYLEMNARNNHCGSRLQCYNMDGRHFILDLVKRNIPFHEAIMNLPANATDFLDVFIGLYTRVGEDRLSSWSLPRIHVYAFSTHVADPVQDIINRSAGILQCTPEAIRYGKSSTGASESEGTGVLETVAGHECSGHIVRDVAPKKVMVCLSFTLPEEVARAKPLDFSTSTGDSETVSDNAAKGTKRDSAAAGLV
eukprot:gene12454-14410_t